MGVFWSGARAGGHNVFTRGGSFPLGLLEKEDEVANLVDSSLMETTKKTERPLLSRANTGSSLAKYLGVLVLAFPPRGQKKCLGVGRPTPQTDRHRLVLERGG